MEELEKKVAMEKAQEDALGKTLKSLEEYKKSEVERQKYSCPHCGRPYGVPYYPTYPPYPYWLYGPMWRVY